MRFRSIFAALTALALAIVPALAADNSAPCPTDDWFGLRSTVPPSLLCKGILAASENKSDEAILELKKVIEGTSNSEQAYTAHENLFSLYFREGKFERALEQVRQMLAEKPRATDASAILSVVSALGQYPDLKVVSNAPSSNLHAGMADGNNLSIPLQLDGKPVTYMLDTGMNISVIAESEARRLGIEVKNSTTQLTDISGGKTGAARVTEVEDVRIGNTHLRHLAFLVLPDTNEPFADLPPGSKGLLGIQVALAIRSFRLGKDGQFMVDTKDASADKSVPLAFDEMMPVIQVGFRGKKLNFTFDTGSIDTTLNPVFAKQFPALAKEGSRRNYAMEGLAVNAQEDSSVFPSLTFSLGKPVVLAPATILLSDQTITQAWASGNLGLDLLLKSRPLTVDFSRMRVTF